MNFTPTLILPLEGGRYVACNSPQALRFDAPTGGIDAQRHLNLEEARTVIVLKRSICPGLGDVENELFLRGNTMMVFGDARETLQKITSHIKGEK